MKPARITKNGNPYDQCPNCDGYKRLNAIMCKKCRLSSSRLPISDEVFLVGGRPCRYIALTRKQLAIVDVKNFVKVSRLTWFAQKNTHTKGFHARSWLPGVSSNGRQTYITMHALILGLKKGEIGDHRNGNTLDNRRCNLRKVNVEGSARNRGMFSTNTSGVTGVYFNKRSRTNPWFALIHLNKKLRNLGRFPLFEQAVRARRKAENKYYGKHLRRKSIPK